MSTQYAVLQTAVFERYQSNASWESISRRHKLSGTTLRRVYAQWATKYPESQLTQPRDINLTIPNLGRRPTLTSDEEKGIADAVLYFADNNTPLSKQGVRDLAQEFISLLTPERQQQIGFSENRPSNRWVTLFAHRNGLEIAPVRLMEDKRVKAVTARNLTEHIARVEAALKRFNIRDPRYIFNTDQSGASFAKVKGRSLRKGVGKKGARLLQTSLTTQGSIDRVTVMSVVSASGKTYKPAIVFPGKIAHYRRVQGVVQSLHAVLPPCYLFQRNPAGVGTEIVFQWAKEFIYETESLRAGNQKLLLLLDGYGSHIQYKTLKLLKDNNIFVIARPAHTSHITQPLDVSVFSSFKSFLQREFHNAARQKTKLNAFDIAQCISNAYSSSHTATNIRSGFHKTGLWDLETANPNFAPLRAYVNKKEDTDVRTSSVEILLARFKQQQHTLLCDASVDKSGHIMVDTKAKAHLTSDGVLVALMNRWTKLRTKQKEDRRKRRAAAYKEPKADIQRLIELASERKIRSSRLCKMRITRRDARRRKARLPGAAERTAALMPVPGPIVPDSDVEENY